MIEPSTLRKSSQAHLDGHPPPRRVVMMQLQNAADEIERLRKDRDDLLDAARRVDGNEPHRIIPAIWPIIQRMNTND